MLTNRKYLSTALLALVMLSVAPIGANASLLGVTPGTPLLSYDANGTLTFDSGTQLLSVSGTPIDMLFPPLRSVFDPTGAGSKLVDFNILVDSTGAVVGGVPGDDLIVIGAVDTTGDSILDGDGVLLTGEIIAFGFQENGTTDLFDFEFAVTGGALGPFYAGLNIAVTTTSDNSTFSNSFTSDFQGGARGNIGPSVAAPEPGTLALLGLGLIGLGYARKRKA